MAETLYEGPAHNATFYVPSAGEPVRTLHDPSPMTRVSDTGCLPLKGCKMNKPYLEVISLIERTHRHFLEVVKLELDRLGIRDINNVQGLLLFNIGDAEMTVGELIWRGCYLGSNVSYNLKKMVEHGYLSQERSVHDRRSINVRLTEKGAKMHDRLQGMHQRHVEMLGRTTITNEDLHAATVTLRRLESFWTSVLDIKR